MSNGLASMTVTATVMAPDAANYEEKLQALRVEQQALQMHQKETAIAAASIAASTGSATQQEVQRHELVAAQANADSCMAQFESHDANSSAAKPGAAILGRSSASLTAASIDELCLRGAVKEGETGSRRQSACFETS